ncbi:hypothetical protein C2G38_694890 [Gigaspora rosea]|uniref:Uncharacterized protein n=1 Tax=Gigaspora rosea TaxID=44941 RepID=A0A397U695_9GLOM|nr:hypothetical protein C2G38_694890 [Gigaspora rosea]
MNSRLFYIFKRNYSVKSLKQLPGSASRFLPIHREALNIHYRSVNSANEIIEPLSENIQINNDLLVSNLTRQDLLLAIPERPILKKLNNVPERSLATYLNRVIQNATPTTKFRGIFTDSLVNYLLGKLKFNIHPFMLMLKPDSNFSVFNKEVSAKAKFIVSKEDVWIFLIDDDKHIYSSQNYTENRDSLMSAEILACAFTNFDNGVNPTAGKSQTVYAMRIIGTRFTFYKAFMSDDYLRSLYQGFPPGNLSATIFRFPPINMETPYGYDYADKDHRSLIIHLLYHLRECLLKM